MCAAKLAVAATPSRLFDQYVTAAVIGLVSLSLVPVPVPVLVLVSRVLREQSAATAELRQIF